jgi:hypothetical protein
MLLEAFEDKYKQLRNTQEVIRLPAMYHPDKTWRRGPGGMYYRTSMFQSFQDPTDHSPRDISMLKIDAVIEEKMINFEMNELSKRIMKHQRNIPALTLPPIAMRSVYPTHVLSEKRPLLVARKKRPRDDAREGCTASVKTRFCSSGIGTDVA